MWEKFERQVDFILSKYLPILHHHVDKPQNVNKKFRVKRQLSDVEYLIVREEDN
jgi:hypothetical protein